MKKTLVMIGTYTQPILFGTGEVLQGHGEGVYVYELVDEHLQLKSVAKTVNASYLTMDAKQAFLYTTNELKEYEGGVGGAVSAFRFDPQSESLTYLNTQPVRGADPCHVVVDSEGKHLYCANFMSGSVTVLPIAEDGALNADCCFIQHEGSSIDPARQRGPHAHGVFFDPTDSRIFVPDLGMDQVICYRMNGQSHQLEQQPECSIPAQAAGSGPRHMVFHPSGKYAYINTEMGSTVCAYRYCIDTGHAEWMQTLSTIPHGTDPATTSTSAIKMHPNGRLLFISNRGHNSLACYHIDQETGMLKLLSIQSTGGSIPRDFDITPNGRYLIAAHQSSDSAVLFRLNSENGDITPIMQLEVPTPICVRSYDFDLKDA